MKLRLISLLLFFAPACTDDNHTGQNQQAIQRIPCQATPDCVARGGMCSAGQCVADNECAVDADCSTGEVCNADVNFGGLCSQPGVTPLPGPAWTCTADADCPTGQSCLRGTCGLPPTTTAEVCNNGSDDDGDGDIDCGDSDCASDPACVTGAEQCANGIDDDGDGDIDCTDLDCVRDAACLPPIEDCTNGVDDDSDNAIDCADFDCASDPACAEIDCSNGLDDDGDGDVDCSDLDCSFDPACGTPVEDCTNGVDDNGDGDVDCADVFCSRDPVCQGPGCNGTNCPCDVLLQNCADPGDRCYIGGPDSADGQCYPTGGQPDGAACVEPPVDTPDACQGGLLCIFEAETDPTGVCRVICATSADCAAGEVCFALFPQPTNYGICHPPLAESCGNGTDDDGDGSIDCSDSDCAADPLCAPPPPPEDCANGIDDDLDGAVDCSDPDCARVSPPC